MDNANQDIEANKNLRIQEILAKLYDPTDIVYVTNPTNEAYRWEQAGEDKRDERGRVTRKIDTYEVKPGAKVPLPAHAASLYIDYMVKFVFGLQGKPGNILQPILVQQAIDSIFVGVNRGRDMLNDVRVSTVEERAGVTGYPPTPEQAPAAPPKSGEFDLADIGLDAGNIESPEGADPDQVPIEQFDQPVAAAPVVDQFPGLNNPTD